MAPRAYFEFQVELFFFDYLDDQEFKVGIICLVIFTTYMTVVAIHSKSEIDVSEGLSKCLINMKQHPTLLYTDDEKAFNSKIIQKV